MAAGEADADVLELAVWVHEGRHFPIDADSTEDFYRVGGLFDDEPRSSARAAALRLAALEAPRRRAGGRGRVVNARELCV